MSFRKTKLIQEKNILLERKYISEQGPVPPPPAPVAPSTPPAPVAPSTVPATPTTPNTTTPNKKFTIEDVKKTPKCSMIKTPPTSQPIEIVDKDGKKYNYYLTSKNDMVLCYDEIVKR